MSIPYPVALHTRDIPATKAHARFTQYAGFYNDEWVASHLPNAHAGGLPFSGSPRLVILNCGPYSLPAT